MYYHFRKYRWMLCLCATLLLPMVLTGCAKQKAEKVKATPAPTEKVLVSPEDPESNLGQWGRAMGSVLISMNEGNVYYFGGYEATEGNKKAAARILEQSWEIKNRTDLLLQIQNLLQTGSRKEYLEEAKEMRGMSKKALKTALKQLSGETLTHYEMVQYNWDKWKKKGLLAWDLCRVSHLVQWGYVAGYLEIAEAQVLIQPAAEKLKNKFTSWDDVQQNWLDGYALFASVDARNPVGTDYEKRQKVYESLKAAQDEDGILYDDSLFQTEIISLTGIDAKILFQEIVPTKEPAAKEDVSRASAKPKASANPKDKPEKTPKATKQEG